MKYLRRYFRDTNDASLEVRERLFRYMMFFGLFASVFAFVESLAVNLKFVTLLPLAILFVVILICMYITVHLHKYEVAATIIGVYMVVVVLPLMFFDNGGIEGGATVWFILGILYAFILFKGKRLITMILLNAAADIAVYGIGYHFPEYISPLANRGMIYVDSLFAVIAVGLFSGGALYYQILLYDRERALVNSQKKELEETNRSQGLFFASMSHEIRTPINSILGLDEMILRRSQDPEVQEYANNIQSSGRMLLKLVNDILDMSQLEQKRMELSPQDYKTEDMLGEIIDMLRIRMDEKQLNFQVDVDGNLPKRLYGDEKRIQQVIINVLTNAVKYTEKGSVSFTVNSIPNEDESIMLQVAVQDTGIGIRKEDMDKLYDVFKRVDMGHNVRVEGSGLGLSITKQLVDMMGGEIKVDSIYTKGTTFTITIPQQVVDADPIGEAKFSAKLKPQTNYHYEHSFEAPEAKVLVVDDNHVNALVLTQLLADTKVNIDIAESGTECLEKTKQKHYNVILMDNMMPDMSGIEAYKIIRKQENGLCQNSPVLLLTATSVAEARKIAEGNGFDGFLEKPVQGDKLEAAVLSFLPNSLIEYRREQTVVAEDAEETSFIHKNKKRLQITTDCVCDLPDALLEEYDIQVMYLYVETKTGRFADTKEIDADNMAHILNGTEDTVNAASASVEEYQEFFAENLTNAENIIHISMAANSGKSYTAAVTAANGFDHVHVIDAGQISAGQGILVLYAANLLRNGASREEIIAAVEEQKKRVRCSFLLPDAESFYHNGYMSRLGLNITRLFSMHPKVSVDGKSRTRLFSFYFGRLQESRARFIHHLLVLRGNVQPDLVMIVYAGLSVEEQKYVRACVEKNVKFTHVVENKASFSSSCNAGLGSVGIAFFKKAGEENR